MKKLLAALLLLVLAGFVWVLASRGRFEPPFAGAFPSGAIAYAAVKDGGALAREVGGSNFWKALRDIESIGAAAPGPGRTAAVAAVPAALSRMLGEEAAIAFYGEKSPFGTSVLFAVKGPEAREALRALARTTRRRAETGEGMERCAFEVPGAPGLRGACAADDAAGFAAVSSRDPELLLKAALDLRAGAGGVEPLRNDRRFRAGIGKPPRGAGGSLLACGWMNDEAIEAAARSSAAAAGLAAANVPAAARSLAASAERFPAVSAGGYLFRDRGFHGSLRTRVDRARLTAEQQAVWPAASGTLGALALAPKGTILVSAARIRNAAAAWELFRADANPVGSAVAGWLSRHGIDFERDVAPWVGDEVSVQLSDVRTGGLFPLAGAELIVAVKDRRAAERAVVRLMEAMGGGGAAGAGQAWDFLRPTLSRSAHRGVEVTTLGYPVPGLSPSFAFVGDRLVVGLDRASVHDIVDTAAGVREPLSSDAVFAAMRAAAPARLNSFAWIDGERALRAGEGVLAWALAVKRLARSVSDAPVPESELRLEADLPRICAAAGVVRAAMTASACGDDTVEQYFAVRLQDI